VDEIEVYRGPRELLAVKLPGEPVADGKSGDAIPRAKALLQDGTKRVMAQEKGLNYTWDQPKDRSIADQVRGEVLDLLEELAAR
jgi:hypothetical protein